MPDNKTTRIDGRDCVAVRARGTYTPITGPTLTYVAIEDVTSPEVERLRAENAELRASLERHAWALAECGNA